MVSHYIKREISSKNLVSLLGQGRAYRGVNTPVVDSSY